MKRLTPMFAIIVFAVLAVAAVVGGVAYGRSGGDSKPSVSAAPTATASSSASNTGSSNGASVAATDDFSKLYDQVRASVVRVTTGQQATDPFSNPAQEGLGSGIVLDKDGHILTNYHVVRGFNSVSITFADGATATARVAGTDPGNDMAVVKADVDASELQPATLGDSSAVKVGIVVAAIGNPFGLDGTLTTGIISGTDRTLPSRQNGKPIRGLLQTDAAVNPGNSGGALFNVKGEVIGINTAIENPGGNTFAGIAYAVPINTPKRFLTQLTTGASIEHPRLGISGKTLSPSEAKKLGVDQGVAVASVDAGSGAGKAGLRASSNGSGDVITAIDGNPMKSFEELSTYVDSKNVGDEVKITVRRDGKDTELTATLRAWDSSA